MACIHLRRLYQLCQEQKLFFSGSDLVNIICKECEATEVCPTALRIDSARDFNESEDEKQAEKATNQ